MYTGGEKFGGWDYSSDVQPSYLYFVLCVHDNKQTYSRSSSWGGCSQGAAAEANTIREKQAEADAIREQ